MPGERRILAIDPGEKRIGVAISDPTLTIASPMTIIKHVSMAIDAAQIAQLAVKNNVISIVVGQALGADGEETPASRHANKLADSIRTQVQIPVNLWDESESTQTARQAKIDLGLNRGRRSGHMDELAAVVILQSYLDERNA